MCMYVYMCMYEASEIQRHVCVCVKIRRILNANRSLEHFNYINGNRTFKRITSSGTAKSLSFVPPIKAVPWHLIQCIGITCLCLSPYSAIICLRSGTVSYLSLYLRHSKQGLEQSRLLEWMRSKIMGNEIHFYLMYYRNMLWCQVCWNISFVKWATSLFKPTAPWVLPLDFTQTIHCVSLVLEHY